jgi:superoxide dismutase, Cu-Zn family
MNLRPISLAIGTVWLISGCATPPKSGSDASGTAVAAVMKPTRGNNVTGTVWFVQDGPVVDIRGRISGLTPNQEHGFHIHEKGDCSSEDAMSAGGHLNPTAKLHGPPDGEHHAGDLPAIHADAKGEASVHARVAGSVLGSGAGDVAGKALVIHAQPDDYATQPSGNSGARIACGVISTTAGRDAAGNPIQIPKDL